MKGGSQTSAASNGSSRGFFASPAPAKSSSLSFTKASRPANWNLSGGKGFFEQASASATDESASAEPPMSAVSNGSSRGFFAGAAPAEPSSSSSFTKASRPADWNLTGCKGFFG